VTETERRAVLRTSGVLVALIAFIILFCGVSDGKGGSTVAFTITSEDFNDGEVVPRLHSCDGEDISPGLSWEGEPEGTKSFVLIMDDPDAPGGTFTHWVVYDMPAGVHNLSRGMGNVAENMDISETIKEGMNDFGRPEYGGPCPPKGHGRHRYFFTITALDIPSLGLPPDASRADVEIAMQGHVLAEAKLMGVYER